TVAAVVEDGPRIEQQDQVPVDPVEEAEKVSQEPVIGIDILAALELREVAAHRAGAPGVVAGEIRDISPILVVRRDGDHRVVRRAPADAGTAWIEDSLFAAIGV